MKPDRIRISRLRVVSRVGVSDEERRRAQSLEVTATLILADRLDQTADQLERTVDYHAVSEAIRDTAMRGERRLIESLAADLGRTILEGFPKVARVTVEVRKFILADAESVSVRVAAARGDDASA